MGDLNRWYIGGQVSVEGKHDLSYAREISEDDYRRFQEQFRFLRELAQQDEFMRLLQCAQAWEELLSTTVDEGAEDGMVSPAAQHKARRGLRALFDLTEEFLSAAELRAGSGDSGVGARSAIQSFRKTDSFAHLRELEKTAEAERDLFRVGWNGTLELAGSVGGDARNLPLALTGYASAVIPNVLVACEGRFRETASHVKEMADEVTDGAPRVMEVKTETGSEKLKNAKLQPLPLRDIAVLESCYGQSDPQDAVSVLVQNRERSAVRFDVTNADMAVRAVRTGDGLDALSRASFDLKLNLIGPNPIDYWAPVTFNVDEGGWEEEMFAGVVQSAIAEGDIAKLKCESGATVIEHTKGGILAAHISPGDLIRSMNAQSGWTGELPLSEEPSEQTLEEFEVIVPVAGLRVEDSTAVGAVELISGRAGKDFLEALDLDGDGPRALSLRESFFNAKAYARTMVTSTSPHEAEDEGIERIETAISWLTTRGRYGTALLPDYSGLDFDRESALVGLEPGPVVLVRGETTDRQWLRWWHGPRIELQDQPEDLPDSITPSLPTSLPIAVRQALLGLQGAVAQRDPYAQTIGIWQAIEAFAAKTKCRKLFSRVELNELRDSIPSGLNAEQHDVLKKAIGKLNEPPVRERMLQRLRRDGIPISDDEVALLDRLRRARNDAVHGRERDDPPSREEINYGIGIVARMLVFRISQLEDTQT